MEGAVGGSAWLDSPPLAYLLRWEQAQLDAALADVFGYYALQLGFDGIDLLRANRISCRVQARLGGGVRCAPGSGSEGPALVQVTQPEELPFASQSLDLVVLPHVLEFAADPHQVLREVDRVLRPEGRLVLTGLNPISLWGVRHLLRGGLLSGLMPRAARLIAQPRLRDWLELLGFAPERAQYGCYRPPCRTQAWLDRTEFVERPGDRWWPICGAVYLLSAVKRVRALRLVGPARRKPASARATSPAVAACAGPAVDAAAARAREEPVPAVSGTRIRETAAAD